MGLFDRFRNRYPQQAIPKPPVPGLDSLTGLNNLAAMMEVIESGEPVGGAVIADLRGFKAVNDKFGYEIGDEILAAIGSELPAALPAEPAALAYRIGGDEFVVIAQDVADLDSFADVFREVMSRKRVVCHEGDWYEIQFPATPVGSSTEQDGTGKPLLFAADRRMCEDQLRMRDQGIEQYPAIELIESGLA